MEFRNYYESLDKKDEVISEKLLKLEDHANIEIARFKFQNELNNTIDKRLKDLDILKSDVDNARDKQDELNAEIEKNKEKFDEKITVLQRDYIAILGIFAAIVVTTFGGLGFIGNSLQGISNDISINRLVFVIILCGFVTFNVIMGLVYGISRIVEKPMGGKCIKTGTECHKCEPKDKENCKNVFDRIKNHMPYIWLIDIVLFLGMILVPFALWLIQRFVH